MSRHIYMTIAYGLPIMLIDGTKCHTKLRERAFVGRIAAAKFSWLDGKGRICTADATILFINA